MESLLNNPVYHALSSGDAPFSFGTDAVKFFDEEVSPFIGIKDGYDHGFDELYQLLPAGRKILYTTREPFTEPKGWEIRAAVKGLQFVFDGKEVAEPKIRAIALGLENVQEMIALATLTKPGPFGPRTIEFGHYYGIFETGQLAAMTGQRLHVNNYTEVSAVCTHPDHLGKGFAAALLQHQLRLILEQRKIPFLHVRADNARAIEIYQRVGFKVNGEMNFYFMKRKG